MGEDEEIFGVVVDLLENLGPFCFRKIGAKSFEVWCEIAGCRCAGTLILNGTLSLLPVLSCRVNRIIKVLLGQIFVILED